MQINTSNYLSLYSNSYNINSKESTQSISQNFNTTENLSQNNKNNVERDTKQIISEILSNKEELPAYISHSYHQNIDNIEKLQNLAQAHLQFIETYNGVIPTELEAKQSIQFLMQEAEEILSVAYNKQPNSENRYTYRNLLGFFSFTQDSINDFSNNKQKLLNLLKQGQSSLEYATSDEFYHKLFTKANGPNTQTLEEIDRLSKINEEQGFLRDYNVNATLISSYLQDFFTMANDFGFISKDKENKIYQELQTSVIYLGSQGGNIGNSFKIENFTISWEGNSTLFNAYLNGSKISIASQSTPNDFLASNFDTTQSIFDILNQKEKLEKENQDLKNKQAIESHSTNTINHLESKSKVDSKSHLLESQSDFIFREILKDSKAIGG